MKPASPETVEAVRHIVAMQALRLPRQREATMTAGELAEWLKPGLEKWIGSAGYGVLVERTMVELAAADPTLPRQTLSSTRVEDGAAVPASPLATEALVAFLAILVTCLGRVVGDDIAIRLAQLAWAGGTAPQRDDDVAQGGS